MRFRYRQTTAERPAVIDMTPIIDIVFNLLLFFLLSSSYVQHSALEVTLPTATTGESLEGEPVVVELTRDDRLYLKSEELTYEDLRVRLTEIYGAPDVDRPLLIRADAHAYHGRIVAILDLARQLGVQALNIETIPGTETSETPDNPVEKKRGGQ